MKFNIISLMSHNANNSLDPTLSDSVLQAQDNLKAGCFLVFCGLRASAWPCYSFVNYGKLEGQLIFYIPQLANLHFPATISFESSCRPKFLAA